MRRRLTLSIALAVSVLSLAPVSSDWTARAQQRQRCTADTGVITLGPNQKLRVVVTGMGGNDAVTVRFRRMEYTQDACGGGFCKLAVASQSTSAPITLRPGEAIWADDWIPPLVRVTVLSNRRNVRVTAAIIDAVTGEPTSTSILETMEDDECGL